MPKRKREEEIEDQISAITDQALRIRVSRLKARFEHGVLQLTAQLKLARGFDRQKMTRRIKQAGKDSVKLGRLNLEVKVLNDLNEGKVARKHLLKQCARTKRIAESEAFIALFGPDAEEKARTKNVSVEESNVLGRLFKSNVVVDVLPGIVTGIKDVLGISKSVQSSGGKGQLDGHAADLLSNTADVSTSRAESDEFEGFSDNSDEDVQEGVLLGVSAEEDTNTDMEDDELEAYDSRLAASSDEESDNLVGLDDMEITTDDEAETDQSDNQSDAESEQELTTQPQQSIKSIKPPTSTSFLPTLMHGGYYSGSDSESKYADSKGYDPDKTFAASEKLQRERKNRRGQRERQAIAEKKFGTRAKHLLKANGAEGVHGDRQRLIQSAGKSKSDGWDARRGAVDTSRPKVKQKDRETDTNKGPNRFERRNGYTKTQNGSGFSKPPRQSNRDPSGAINGASDQADKSAVNGKAAIKSNERLHPSWEAARKKKMDSAAASNFAGKKITFD